ncbi:MAG: WG repeat-containing protein, partial [Elusimicrobia bacterium]|nr:WG repeat-containing protein [Elusimicrobiota bacterium]
KYGFFDRSGRVKLEPRFDSVLPLGKDRALAEQDGKCGVVDRDGALTAALSVGACGTRRAEESPQAGRGTRVPVKSGGRWGYADETGRLVIPAAFDLAGRFVDGLAPVNDGGREAWIDASGKRVWTARPDPLAAERREAAAGRRSRAESGEAHTRTIRVLVAADQLVRRKPDWAEAAGKRLGAVSEVFEKNFKIRLELARVVPWETPALDDHDDPDDYMPALVGLLRREVPLLDADMVIGYTGQGVRVPGRDLGMAGAFDPKVLVYDTGLEPKTAAVTVHELLHAFGMFHVADERSFMHAAQPPGVDASWGLDRWSVDSYTARLMSLTRGIDFTKGPDALTPKTIKELAALDAEGGGIAGNRIGRVSSPAAWAYESRGHHLLASGEIVAGLRDFNKAIELDAAAPDFYTFEDLGIGLLRVGKNKEGFGALRRCVELKPDCAHCRYSLAHWLEAKAAEAEAFERSLPPPGPWEIAELYGRPDRAEALEHYRRASGLEPRNALYHARLGEALLKRGATAEAVAELRRAAEL